MFNLLALNNLQALQWERHHGPVPDILLGKSGVPALRVMAHRPVTLESVNYPW